MPDLPGMTLVHLDANWHEELLRLQVLDSDVIRRRLPCAETPIGVG